MPGPLLPGNAVYHAVHRAEEVFWCANGLLCNDCKSRAGRSVIYAVERSP